MKTVSPIQILFSRIFVCFIVSNLIVAGCALQHPVAPFHFTAPMNNQRFTLGAEITIKLRSTLGVEVGHDSVEYEIMDNGNSIIPGRRTRIPSSVRDIVLPYPVAGRSTGTHLFQARARGIKATNPSETSRWFETQVCVWIGPNPPTTFTCSTVFGWPQALEAAPANTMATPVIIPLEEPQLLEEPLLQLPDLLPTATPEACIWQAMLNVYFRKGPDVGLYDKLDAVEKGTTLPIVGQSEDGVFWVVQIHPDLNGYVTKSDKYSHTTGDCSKVLTLKDPELPVIVPAPQNQPNGGAAARLFILHNRLGL